MEQDLEQIAKNNNYELDYLSDGSPIFASRKLYTFTSDSTKLSKAVNEEGINHLVDLCAGGGIVGLEVISRIKTQKLTMIELQEDLAKMASLSASVNKTATKIEVLNINARDALSYLEPSSVDVITCNPPYFKRGSGEVSTNNSRALARHEVTITLEEIIALAANLLKAGGKLYMVHISSRLEEIKKLLNYNNLKIINETILEGKLERVIISAQKV